MHSRDWPTPRGVDDASRSPGERPQAALPVLAAPDFELLDEGLPDLSPVGFAEDEPAGDFDESPPREPSEDDEDPEAAAALSGDFAGFGSAESRSDEPFFPAGRLSLR